MKIINTIVIAVLAFAMLMLGSAASLSQGSCAGKSEHTIQVRPGPDDVPVLTYQGGSAEDVHVCIGDTIKWVLNGPDRQYFVDFLEGAPFAGEKRRGSSGNMISVTVGGPAERGSSYKYDVEFEDGGTLDPRIIVDR